jgi:hypothetical protein
MKKKIILGGIVLCSVCIFSIIFFTRCIEEDIQVTVPCATVNGGIYIDVIIPTPESDRNVGSFTPAKDMVFTNDPSFFVCRHYASFQFKITKPDYYGCAGEPISGTIILDSENDDANSFGSYDGVTSTGALRFHINKIYQDCFITLTGILKEPAYSYSETTLYGELFANSYTRYEIPYSPTGTSTPCVRKYWNLKLADRMSFSSLTSGQVLAFTVNFDSPKNLWFEKAGTATCGVRVFKKKVE